MQKNVRLSWLLNLLNINFKTYKNWVNNGSKDYKTKRINSYDLFIKLVFNDYDFKYGTHRKWGHKKTALKFGNGRKTVLSSMKSQGLFPDNCEKRRKWKYYVSGKKRTCK
ncbi:hypothetical protein [Spiroplasma turonicum]|uniref:Uncharacterized protein n=1 Tax=Spiroplasma turonicum TaxID=216946 RepID=A0A0K1P6H1_9MOLU|nr:hypothetical protein [Spiroplasma turonicum]AKU79880.1 hypothetical protein STURON_00634 [Spiroplasma turonicum]